MNPVRVWLAAVACLTLAVALVWAVLDRPPPVGHLPTLVDAALEPRGGLHPLTAVLLDFRAFDTLLEVGVLLLAVVVALALREVHPDGSDPMGLNRPLLQAVLGLLLPLMLMVGAYVLWAGSTRPGGAFQAGAIFAAAGLAARLSGVHLPRLEAAWQSVALLAAGLAVFVAAGVWPALAGRALLQHHEDWVVEIIVGVEIALTTSIALGLLALFRLAPAQAGAPTQPPAKPGEHG